MTTQRRILGVDVGRNTGFYFSDDDFCNGSIKLKNYKLCKDNNSPASFPSMLSYYKLITSLCDLLLPEEIVVGVPTMYHNTIARHSEQIGILQLICEQRSICMHRVTDSACKKEVIGKGNADKPMIIQWAELKGEHQSDAKMFVKFAESEHVINKKKRKKKLL